MNGFALDIFNGVNMNLVDDVGARLADSVYPEEYVAKTDLEKGQWILDYLSNGNIIANARASQTELNCSEKNSCDLFTLEISYKNNSTNAYFVCQIKDNKIIKIIDSNAYLSQ